MADATGKPVIFISYSHLDRAWLDYVRSFFEPLAEHWNLQIWDDEKLRIGDDWRDDIYSALDACRIFILLVSRYALASAFICNDEVGRILQRPKGAVQFCPIVVTPYYTRPLPWLDQPNRRPKDGKALSELSDPDRDREMAVIAGQIDAIVESFAETTIPEGPPVIPSIIRAAFPSIVDYGRLPENPYKKLVGREDELGRLDDAWADERTRIISLIARGGAGKTSLVIEWLTRVRADGYRNADAVLCWSFYSQGTTERAASGEGFLDWALGKLRIKLDTTSATAKGERLAEEMSRRRVLLVLDGLEPLQFGPEGQQGALKDQGLRAFLRGLAVKQPAAGHSLVVLTSRVRASDLRRWEDSTAPLIDLGRLSDEAGAALLADGGVKGTAEELRNAAHDFAGHALALSLLAGFLRLLHDGEARERHRIRPVIDDPNDPGHDQARRVIEAFTTDWLAGEPLLLAIMHMVGLFDRPARADWVAALRREPAIEGLTDGIADLDDDAWRVAIVRLRDVRLLDPEDSLMPDAIDAHPLVREWFGERLQRANEKAWREAHGRMFEHLRDSTKEGKQPTLADLAPLYQAIAHGCRAGRHQEALDDIYANRICRWRPDGHIEFYASRILGALGSNLTAISWFFEVAYEAPAAILSDADRTWVLSQAAYLLRGQGRFAETLPAERAVLRMAEAAEAWTRAASAAANLSQTQLLVGEIAAAAVAAATSVQHAERSGDRFWMMASLAAHAHPLQAAGARDEAAALFAAAERRQREWQPKLPLLYSLQGYFYCDLLLAKGNWSDVRQRAEQTLEWAKPQNLLLDIGLNELTLGRTHLGLALARMAEVTDCASAGGDARTARLRLDQAIDGLRRAGWADHIARGLVTRATFRRNVGNWVDAARDLDEVQEIAEPGPMRLYLCDMALERARLAFARIEAFAPLNGMLEKDNPSKPERPSEAEIAKLKEEAAKQLAVAADYIKTCGYHRRDEELAELQAVLAGARTFALLPPRV